MHQTDLAADPGTGEGGGKGGFDPVPECLQQPSGFVPGVRAVAVNRVPGRVAVEHPYA